MKKILLATLLALFALQSSYASNEKTFRLLSPDNKIIVEIKVGCDITFNAIKENTQLFTSLPLSVETGTGKIFGTNPKIVSIKEFSKVDSTMSPFYRFKSIKSEYNMLDIKFKDNFGLLFASSNEGFAYKFYFNSKEDLIIVNENTGVKFSSDRQAYLPYVRGAKANKFQASFQSLYDVVNLSKADTSKIIITPLTIVIDDDTKLTLAESNVVSYPGLFYKVSENFSLKAIFTPYPAETFNHEKRKQEMVKSFENHIAGINGKSDLPWRIFVISTSDTQLPVNNMVYELADKCVISDPSWIKPGKIAWDWWNDWGITGVDFKVGINNDTYKYFIDFASRQNIEYVVLDEGWSLPAKGDIMSSIPEIDIDLLARYAKEKNVGLILWVVGNVLDSKLDEACKYYSEKGIKGFKVDFFDRDDQPVKERIVRIAQKCADYKLVLDLHGVNRPAGINRKYPNILNLEGVFGLEELKWDANADMVQYDVTAPFIRMLAGPFDYTQGAMTNATKKDFRVIYSNPMSQGTRAHQFGTYIVFDSPLVTLCDAPSAYIKEKESADFIVSIPTYFDFTRVLDGRIGEYIVTARKRGDNWYIGGLNNWTARTIKVDLSFLEGGNYKATIMKDGLNANKRAQDYKKEVIDITTSSVLEIPMAQGGGFAVKIERL
ncbi:MAG: glycoside hydrolase family 97 catalytic domain-containing protein [Bacteroidales bacterium]|jgi:alpha-glucosidase